MFRKLSALVFALTVVAQSAVGADLAKRASGWIEVKTANFTFFSNAGKGATKRFAVDLEELRAALAELTDYQLQGPVPTSIYVFRNDRSFTPYKNLYKGEPAAVSGYFVGRRYGNFIAVDGSARDSSAIVFHEYVHWVVATNDWRLPLWFEEGLAEFYQSFQVVGDTVYLGLPVPQHLAYLHGSTPIPLTELLNVTRESPLYNEEQRKGAFYAQSWALVHYLLLGDTTRRQELGRYLEMLHQGKPESVAFDDAFGTDHETLAGELRMYLKRDRLPYGTTRAEILPASVLDVRSMSVAETLYRLGELLLSQSSDRPEAVEHFASALHTDPDLGGAAAALAVTAEMRGDADTARALYQRAVRTAPDDPLVLLRWGEFLFRSEGELDAAAAELERCVAVDPGLAPAWVELAKVYADSGSTSEQALNAAETAHRLLPSDPEVTSILLRLLLRADRRDRAIHLIRRALSAAPPATLQEAWMAVVQNDILRARHLLSQESLEEVRRRLDLAAADAAWTGNPDLVNLWIDEVRQTADDRQATAGCVTARELFDGGKIDEARRLAEEILEAVDDRGMAALRCRQILRSIDHVGEPVVEQHATETPQPASPTVGELEVLNRYLANRDFEGAARFLKELRAHTSGEQRQWVDSKLREVSRAIAYNRFVDAYNRAVALYNEGDYTRAIAVLEELLSDLEEGPDAAAARQLLEDSRKAQED